MPLVIASLADDTLDLSIDVDEGRLVVVVVVVVAVVVVDDDGLSERRADID